MPITDRERDLHALRNLIDEAQVVITTAGLPEDRTKRAAKLLGSALALTDDLLSAPESAEAMGRRGGAKTAERGSEYFRQIAAKRKTKSGGRPKRST